jgi:hypothetical protein
MESNDEQAPPSSGGGSLEPAPAGAADDAAPPASIRDPETGKWVNSRDPSLVWDAAMGGWVHPLGDAESYTSVFNSATGHWVAPPEDKPGVGTGTERWTGGPPSDTMYQREREPLFSFQTKATAAAAFIAAIALLIFAPRGNSSTDTPGVHATPTPTPTATIPGLPGDFTG